MSPFKKAKVILLPTGFIARRNEIGLQAYKTNLRIINNTEEEDLIFYQQHLYIISDDEIKEGDWKYDTKLNIIIQHGSYVDGCKKIIATTDTSLGFSSKINHGVSTTTVFTSLPQPSQKFIQKFVEEYNKGNVITDVLVEYETLYDIELLVDTQDFRKGSYIRGRCSSKGDFSKAKRRFFELHTDGNHYSIARDINKVNTLYKTYFRDVEFTDIKINPKDNTITIKKVKDNWNREEIKSLLFKFTNDFDLKRNIEITLDMQSKWIEENL